MKDYGRLNATIKAVGDDTGPGAFEAFLSVPTVDRDGEILDGGAFDPLPDHITIDVDHAMSVEKTVASGQPFYEGSTLKFRGTFASTPLAQTVRTLVKEGHVRSMSVAYRAAQYEDEDGIPHLRKAELLNAGIVGIPANRDALIVAAKGMQDGEKAGARNSGADLERIQNAHDLFVDLGAACKAAHPSNVKASTATDPDEAAASAAADRPADVTVALTMAEIELALVNLDAT